MTREEWYDLKEGDRIQHVDGSIETVVEFWGRPFIDSKTTLFEMTEFDYREFTKLNK